MKFFIWDINDDSRGWGGVEFNTKEDFLNEISEMIDDCVANGVEGFGISITTDGVY